MSLSCSGSSSCPCGECMALARERAEALGLPWDDEPTDARPCSGDPLRRRNVANEDPLAWHLSTLFVHEHVRELSEMSTSTIKFRARLAELIADVRANKFYPQSPALPCSSDASPGFLEGLETAADLARGMGHEGVADEIESYRKEQRPNDALAEDWADGVDAAAGVLRAEIAQLNPRPLAEIVRTLEELAENYPGRAHPRPEPPVPKARDEAEIDYEARARMVLDALHVVETTELQVAFFAGFLRAYDARRPSLAPRTAVARVTEAIEKHVPFEVSAEAWGRIAAALDEARAIDAQRRESASPDAAGLRDALALAVRWMGDPSDPLGTFEDIGDWFYRDTGYLRPGKSEPLECGGRDEERQAAWKEWTTRTRDHVQKVCRVALSESAPEVRSTPTEGA